MNCPRCGIEIPAGNAVCSACGASLVSGDPLSAAPSSTLPPVISLGPLKSILDVVGSLFCFLLIVALSSLATMKTYHSSSAEAAGYLIGRCLGAYLLSLIIVFLYYRKRHPKPAVTRRFFVTSAGALAMAFISFAGELNTPKVFTQQEMQQHIAELAKEAGGLAPVTPDQTKWDSPVRAFFADIKTFNENYMKEVDQLDNSALKSLYTADSFRSPGTVKQTVSQLQATLSLEEKYASLQPILNKFKERIRASDASKSEKDAVLQGFEESARKSLEPRESTAAKEREWLQASIDLYEFIQASQDSYSVRGGKLIFNSTGLATSFNEKIHKATELRSEFNKAQAAFHRAQSEKLGQFGLQPSDFGAPNHE